MNREEMIAVQDFCHYHQIEVSFIQSLEDSGLIEISRLEENKFIPFEEMPRIEKFIRMHYELEINVEGLETIDYLLQKMEMLQAELERLRFRLSKQA